MMGGMYGEEERINYESERGPLMSEFESIVQKILTQIKITRDELMKRIHQKRSDLYGFVTLEGCAKMIAKELGVEVEK